MTAGRVSGLFRALSLALIIPGLSDCLAGPGPADGKTPIPAASSGGYTVAPEPADAKYLAAIPKAMAKPEAKPKLEKIYPPPSDLTGMSHFQVIGLLGEPGFKRDDDPAQIWQYRTKTCALDVFLYRSGDETVYRVDHFEARHREKGEVTAKDCFVALLKAREQRQAG
jgi:hypothetical protein